MPLDPAGTFINTLDASLPLFNDPRAQGDDHLRSIKSRVKATFPSLTGAVNATQTELNALVGLGSNLLVAKGATTRTLTSSIGLPYGGVVSGNFNLNFATTQVVYFTTGTNPICTLSNPQAGAIALIINAGAGTGSMTFAGMTVTALNTLDTAVPGVFLVFAQNTGVALAVAL